MFAPTQTVTLDDGSSVELGTLFAERPLALVFLRHFGCMFCREIVGWMNRHPEANVVFVAGERVEECARFRERTDSSHRFVSDPGRSLFEAFGLGRGRLAQLMNANTVRRGIAAMRQGFYQGVPTSDPMMLGGAFVVDTDGCIAWEYRSRDMADNPSSDEILGALARAEKGEVKFYPFAGIAQR